MKKVLLSLLLAVFSAGILAPSELPATVSQKFKSTQNLAKNSGSKQKNRQGPPGLQGPRGAQGPKGNPGPQGPQGPTGSIATEYMNLSNPLSDEVLEFDLEPFSFAFSEHSPDTKNILYANDAQDPHIVLQPGIYLVSYDLQGFLGISWPRNWPSHPGGLAAGCDAGSGWTVELAAMGPGTTAAKLSHRKCTYPIHGGCISLGESGEKLSTQYLYILNPMGPISHSHVVEVPNDTQWDLRLKSEDYPQVLGALPKFDGSGHVLPYKLYFLGNAESSASPINMFIVRIGEPS